MPFNYKSFVSLDEMLDDKDYMHRKRCMLLTRITIDAASGCWNYTRYTTPEGRAKTQIGYKSIATARLSYIVFNQKPIGKLCVCHRCDNPSCINPEHLWLGTAIDNVKDRDNKHRTGKTIGERNIKCKLSDADVRSIRSLSKNGEPTSKIAITYGISYKHAHDIIHERQRKYVK